MNDLEKQIAIMQKFKNGRSIQQKAIKSGSDWIDVKVPSWNWSKYEYREKPVIKINCPIKYPENRKVFSIGFTKSGFIRCSNSLRVLLRNDANLVMTVYLENILYSSVVDRSIIDYSIEDTINQDDIRNLKYILTFLKSLSSGIRRPSQKYVALESSKNLEYILSKFDK